MLSLVTLALTLTFASADQNPVVEPPPMPVITRIQGQPITAVWPDGNKAEIQIQRNSPISEVMAFGMSENLCTATQNGSFDLKMSLQIVRMGWVWTVHSTPGKVGQPLKLSVRSRFPGLPLIDTILLDNGTNLLKPKTSVDLPPDELLFTDIKWIPGLEDGVNRPIQIDAWLSELMAFNPETETVENRFISSVNGMHLQPLDDHRMRVVKMDHGSSLLFRIPILVGDVVTWVFDSRSCQIGFKPNLGEFSAKIEKYLAALPDKFALYNLGEDEMVGEINNYFFEQVNYGE